MPIKILMPALSPTMTEGNLARWLKKEGDKVKAGDVIAEIETDKATMEVEAVDEGTLGKILVQGGTQGVAVNKPIALLLEKGEKPEVLKNYSVDEKPAVAKAEVPQPMLASQTVAAVSQQPATQAAALGAASPSRIFASPLARRVAQENSVNLSLVKGSGPAGRIVRSDVEAFKASSPVGTAANTSAGISMPAGVNAIDLANKLGMPYTTVPNSLTRKTIAKRLLEAKQTVPHFYLTVNCRIDLLMEARQRINESGKNGKISVNDFVIKAAAMALRKVPAANASWSDEAILLYNDVDVSMAVASPSGLITPIIKNADLKGLCTISTEAKDLATRAREGKLKPLEYQGGTFCVSNLGMFGISEFSAIINPPQACILAVGAAEKRPVVSVDGKNIEVGTVMSCTLSCDHRVVDGSVGAEFLAVFKKFIENPIEMLV